MISAELVDPLTMQPDIQHVKRGLNKYADNRDLYETAQIHT